jgi:hypothetical protein
MEKLKRIMVWLVADGSALTQLEFYDEKGNIVRSYDQRVFINAFQAYKYAKQLSGRENVPITVDIIP